MMTRTLTRSGLYLLPLLAVMATQILAAPHLAGPRPVSDELMQTLRQGDFQLADDAVWTRALLYGDERTIVWLDPTTGGFIRGIWLLEKDGIVKSKASDGQVNAVNLLFGGGHRILPAPKNGSKLGDWKPESLPDLTVKEVPEQWLTEITFNGRFRPELAANTDSREIAYRARYQIRYDWRLIDVHFEIDCPKDADLSSILITLESLGTPYKSAQGPISSRPITGFDCGAWSSDSYFEGHGRSTVTQTGAVTKRLPTDLSSVRNAPSSDKRDRAHVSYRKDLRKPWMGLYNGNWDENGYQYGIDYSIVREFGKDDNFNRVALTEIPTFQGDKLAYCTVSADAALDPATFNGTTHVWNEKLYLNRSDYQMYLRKTKQ